MKVALTFEEFLAEDAWEVEAVLAARDPVGINACLLHTTHQDDVIMRM